MTNVRQAYDFHSAPLSLTKVIFSQINIMNAFYLLACVFVVYGDPEVSTTVREAAVHDPANPSDTTYRIIPSGRNSFGYEIWIGSKKVILQKSIPGLPGKTGFINTSDASKTAGLVIRKLQQGLMPPTITKKELDSMKIRLPHF